MKALTFITAFILMSLLSLCEEKQPQFTLSEEEIATITAIDVYDPLEPFNRRMYRFNAVLDEYVMYPVVKGYRWVAPYPVQKGVSNFFSNLGEIPNFFNHLLQFKIIGSGKVAGRFAINTTIGVAGLFDWATDFGLEKHKEDLGQTLGFYNVGNGPYIVLPLFGPSNLRDTTGRFTELWTMWELDVLRLHTTNRDWVVPNIIMKTIDQRNRIRFNYYEQASPFEYEFMRYLYTKRREKAIAN